MTTLFTKPFPFCTVRLLLMTVLIEEELSQLLVLCICTI